MNGCGQHDNVAAYVLRALPEDEHERFVAHLPGCDVCSRDVAALQVVVDTLPLATPPMAPPAELLDRIMLTVRAEAELLRASGAKADQPPAPARPKRPWWRRPVLALRPLPALIAAAVLLAVGVTTGLLVAGGGDTRTVTAQVSVAAAPDATAALLVEDDRTRLRLRNFPAPPAGDIYQVWLKLEDRATPVSADVLFDVPADGSATVDLRRRLSGVEQVLVTAEPAGGSPGPTSAPVIVATTA